MLLAEHTAREILRRVRDSIPLTLPGVVQGGGESCNSPASRAPEGRPAVRKYSNPPDYTRRETRRGRDTKGQGVEKTDHPVVKEPGERRGSVEWAGEGKEADIHKEKY